MSILYVIPKGTKTTRWPCETNNLKYGKIISVNDLDWGEPQHLITSKEVILTEEQDSVEKYVLEYKFQTARYYWFVVAQWLFFVYKDDVEILEVAGPQ